MPQQSGDPSATWGYLCVIEHADQGIFGGYLLVNELARPLEFHCTTPVKPTRAQEILYGAALISYLYGERIGKTLVEKASRTPTAILVDDSRAATVGDFVNLPVVIVQSPPPPSGVAGDGQSLKVPPDFPRPGYGSTQTAGTAGHASSGTQIFAHDVVRRSGSADFESTAENQGGLDKTWDLGGRQAKLVSAADKNCDGLAKRLRRFARQFDMLEPFERIRQAIEEARRYPTAA